MDVAEWLRALGLERYQATFREHEITAAILPRLSADDLKELGVVAVGHRRLLLDAIASLRAGNEPISTLSLGDTQGVGQPAAERRQVSVMFCDIVDSTLLSAQLDPEDLSAVIRGYQSLAASTVARFGGFIARYVGDGILAYFGWPEAHERDAERTVRAALAIIAAIDQGLIHGQRLRVRIGIATGLVVIGTPIGSGDARQQTAIGQTPNVAARLQGLAGPGEIAIDETTHKQLGGLFEYRNLGRLELKGLPDPVSTWLVLKQAVVSSRFEALHASILAPLIGRDAELALLEWCWQQALRGEGQAILVSGEAGIGKSRLIAALEQRLKDTAPTRFRYFCSPDQTDTALYPVITALQQEASFVRGDTDGERLTKLHSLLAPTAISADDIALIADTLSIPQQDRPPVLDASPQIRKERTFAALVARLKSLSLTNPLLIVLEDAHWADASSVEFFNAAIPALMDVPVLLVASTRSDDAPTRIGGEGLRTLILPRLSRRHATTLASSIAAGATLPPGLLSRIIEQSDGIPLFVEEMTKTVLETTFGSSADPIQFKVPASLQASLLARLDRIPDAKELAQIGAVVGREFSHSLVMAIAGHPEPMVLRGLQQLVNSGLAIREGSPPDANYVFKHALVRDTAYGMLLRSRRRELHAKTADALEKQSPELRERQPELLAHHYTEAGIIESAIAYWDKAAHRSVTRSAMIEAAAQLRQALALVPKLEGCQARLRRELELQGIFGGVLFELHSWADGLAAQAYTRALELAEQLEDVGAMIPVLSGLVMYYAGQCQYRAAIDLAKRLLDAAERDDDPRMKMIAHRSMGVCLHWTGDAAGALEQFDRVLTLYNWDRDRNLATVLGFDARIQVVFLSCFDLMVLGHLDQALMRFELGRSLIADTEHMHSRALAYGFGGIFSLFSQNHRLALDQLTRSFELATRHNFVAWEGISSMVLGSIFVAKEDPTGGLAQALSGYDKYTLRTGPALAGTGLALNSTYYRTLLSRACEAVGNMSDACTHLDAAIKMAEETDECWFEPELYRLKGELMLRQDPDGEAQAESMLRLAADQAARRNALFWELRASVSLARLHLSRGRPVQASEALAPIYHRFTEGFGWPDVRDAKLLIERLSP
jgi:class 3 adenylate cyclase/predicted ATPase